MEGFTPEDLKRIIEIKNITADVNRVFNKLNKEFKIAGNLAAEVSSEFRQINRGADQFVQLQEEASKSSSATLKAIKEQTKQQNVVKTLNIQIDDLYTRALKTNGQQSKILLKQAQTLSSARDNAKELANSFGDLAKSSSKIDNSTLWFSSLSEFVKDIPGLRKLSGPFDAAAKASRETVLNNAKSKDVLERIGAVDKNSLKTGKNLTKEKLKQLNLTDITQGKTGPAAAKMLRDAKATSKVQNVGVAGLKAGFKSLGPIISKALGPLALLKIAADIAKFFFDAMVGASKATAEMSRNMLISREAAGELYKTTIPGIVGEFNELNAAAGNVTITIGAYEKALASINNELGMQLNLSEDFGRQTAMNVAEVAKMQVNFGLSAKASTQLFLEATRTNQPLEEMNKSIFGTLGLMSTQSGLQLDLNKVIEEAVGISGNMRANFGGSTEAIAKGVFQAKLLGLSLSQMEGISGSLLNFQSSIEAEMEAELLTGKQLNLEKAREAALMGDMETLMKEISTQAGSQEEFLKMNIIQRQALAKAVGMEVNELADMYKKQAENDALAKKNLEIQNKLRKDGKSLLSEEFDIKTASLAEIRAAAQKAGKSEEELRDILGDQIYLRKQEEDATQKFNKALEQAKDAFARLVDGGALDALADILTGLTESAMFSGFKKAGEAKRLQEQAEETKDQEKIDIAAKSTKSTQAASTKNDIKRLMIGFATLGLPGVFLAHKENKRIQDQADKDLEAAQMLIDPKDTEKVDDFIIRPGQRPIKFNKDDLLIGGTNLGGSNNDEITTLLKELISAVKQGGDVYIDGAKAGKSLALATSRMG